MRQEGYIFLNSTWDIEDTSDRHATLPFFKIDIRHWGPPSKAPDLDVYQGTIALTKIFCNQDVFFFNKVK